MNASVSRSDSRAPDVHLELIGRHDAAFFDFSAAEIAAFHSQSRKLFVVNVAEGMELLDISDPRKPIRNAVRRQLAPSSVAVHGDLVALSALGASRGAAGIVRFFDPSGRELRRVSVGFGPDMVAFTPDGKTLLVACEGECPPDGVGAAEAWGGGGGDRSAPPDPIGSISLIDLSNGVENATVEEIGFESFESQRAPLIEQGLRVVTPGRSLAEDLEPEYISVAPDGRRAFVTLQENNAIAIVDLEQRRVVSIAPLGFRDCSLPGQGLDAVVDGVAAPRPVPVLAMYQPDAIVSFEHGGTTWLVTANEGEAREGAFDEAVTLQQALMMQNAALGEKAPAALGATGSEHPFGKLTVSCLPAPLSYGGGFCVFGSRSISLWRVIDVHDSATPSGANHSIAAAPIGVAQAWDSGEAFERLVAERTPRLFNSDHHRTTAVDARSLSKGPEPEGLALAMIGDRRLVFVTLERSGGVAIVDFTDPDDPIVVGYENSRDPGADLSIDLNHDMIPDQLDRAGDLGPEGLLFIPAASSPTGQDLLVVCGEVSGTVSLFRIHLGTD